MLCGRHHYFVIVKRLSSKSSAQNPAWKLAKPDATSSPSALTNEYLKDMGIGMLDSEESSSSAASAIVLATAEENSNDDATPNLDAPKISHQQRQIYRNTDTSLLDANTDNASNHSFLDPNDTQPKTSVVNINNNATTIGQQPQRFNINNNSNSTSSFDIYTDEQLLQQQTLQKLKTTTMDKFQLPHNTAVGSGIATGSQQKKVAILGIGASNHNNHSPSSGGKNTRSPLATVSCNSFLRNTQQLLQQQQQQHIQLQQQSNTLPQISQSPSMLPSTSQQAALLKQQQQLQKQYIQQQCHLVQQQQLQPRFVPNENFFLYRNQLMRQRNPDGKDHFNTLSDEIILQIFKLLPKKTLLRCGYVCCRFNRCASDESLWTRLDLGGHSIKSGAMENILKRGVVILRLAQTELNHPILEPRFLEAERNFESKLQYLDLSMVSITKPSLKMLLSCCRQLKKLSLEHVALNDEICTEISKNTGLEALNLAMCSGLEAWSVRKLMENLTQLNSLNISWAHLSVEAVTSLVKNVTPNLIRLNISGCRRTMFDSHLVSLHNRCPQLLELDLSDCISLTSTAITVICQFKMLEYLSLSRCYLIPVTAYAELSNMATLKYLDIFGMLTDSALSMLDLAFSKIGINKFMHSSVARPTVGTRRTSIWGLRTRD